MRAVFSSITGICFLTLAILAMARCAVNTDSGLASDSAPSESYGRDTNSHESVFEVDHYINSARLMLKRSIIELTPRDFVSLLNVAKPGWYTAVMFSTKSCINCPAYWRALIDIAAHQTNLAVVKVEYSFEHAAEYDMLDSSEALFSQAGFKSVPSVIIVHPVGLLFFKGEGLESLERLKARVEARNYTIPVDTGGFWSWFDIANAVYTVNELRCLLL